MKKYLLTILLVICIVFSGCGENDTTPPTLNYDFLQLKALILNDNTFTFEELDENMFITRTTSQNGILEREYALAVKNTITEFPQVDAVCEDEELVDLTVESINDENKIIVTIRSIDNPEIYYKYIFFLWFNPSRGIDLSI